MVARDVKAEFADQVQLKLVKIAYLARQQRLTDTAREVLRGIEALPTLLQRDTAAIAYLGKLLRQAEQEE